jgi:hypothetical protein
MLGEHLLLTALPGVLAVFLAMRRGLRSTSLLLTIGLAGSGAAAMFSFWAFYADPVVGKTAAVLVVITSGSGIVVCWRRGLDNAVLRTLAAPVALWVLGSAFVLFFGFLHGGTDQPLRTAANRFSHPLPGDNAIPQYFADWFYVHGHSGTPPLFGDWLASDRPPLQMGYVMAQRPFGWDGHDLHYEVLAVVVQQLWILGMWAVLCAARVRPFARGLAVVAAMASDVAIVHGFYVWPKLIAAAFLLAALAVVLSPDWRVLRGDYRVGVLVAALCSFAMLAHGSSTFFVIPLLIVGAVRGLPDWRWIGVGTLVGVSLLGSWSAYQHYGDPPGDRLIKWHLGGSLAIDDRGSLETIVDGYEDAGLDGALENKWHNVTAIVGTDWVRTAIPDTIEDVRDGRFEDAATVLRGPRFFSLFSFLGLLLLAPIAMAVARLRGPPSGREWHFSLVAFAVSGVASVAWVLMMFGGPIATTTIHVGTMAVPLLLVCACVVGAEALSRRFAVALVGTNALFVLALYAPSFTPPRGTSYSTLGGVLAAASLAAFAFVALASSANYGEAVDEGTDAGHLVPDTGSLVRS